MASYKYEVVGADGKPKTGTIEAMNMEVASAELKSGGNTIVSIARANAFNKDLEIHIGKAVSVREMSVFCRQFESVLNAGVTVVEALDMLSEQTENKPFANAIAEVRDSVQRGETLAVAMAEHPKIFPNLMVQMVAAGESSGGLDKAFSPGASPPLVSTPIVLICFSIREIPSNLFLHSPMSQRPSSLRRSVFAS